MEFKVCLIIVICAGIALPAMGALTSSKKINRSGKYLPYHGYTIVAQIDTNLAKVSKQVERFMSSSSFSYHYSPLPANTYHMSIYTIYSVGNKLIPPVKRWYDRTGERIRNSGALPLAALEEENNKAMCVLEKYLNEPLRIKYASLKIGTTLITLTLEVDERSLELIRNARKKLEKVYEHKNLSMEPVEDKLHITLAYAFGRKMNLDIDAWNKLNELVRQFNGASLMVPSVYQFKSMKEYYPFEKQQHIVCSSYDL